MKFNIRLTDTPDAAIREAIVTPLIEYNTARSGINDHRLLGGELDLGGFLSSCCWFLKPSEGRGLVPV